jgi:ATPase family associated with various cellular activities (AAA)
MKKPADRKEPSLLQPLVPRPLADRLRPRRLEEVVGQDHLLRPDGPIGRMVASGRLTSMILWGPPGCGKTTIARLLALRTDLEFVPLSAVFSGVADLRKVFEQARASREAGRGTLHRRDPPLQPRSAGRLPAVRRGRHGHAGRRHHRKSVVRAEPAAARAAACWC